MPGQPCSPVIPLPKQWNKRVRSAVLDAISLAHVRGRRGQRLDLRVTHLAGRSHLPIVELKKAA